MKALVISPQPFFSPRGTPFSVYYRTLVLCEQGVDVDLLTYGEGQDVEIKGMRTIRIPAFPFLGAVKTGPSLLKLFLDLFMIVWTIGMLIRRRYDFVHAHEEAVFWCRMLKPLFGFKLVYDMHSSLPQQLNNFNFTQSKLLVNIFAWLEDSAIGAADGVITICPDLWDHVESLGVCRPGTHYLIENSIFDPVKLKTTHTEVTAAPPSIPDFTGKQLIVYAGTLEHYQGVHLILEGMAHSKAHLTDARLLVMGGTPDQVAKYQAIADGLSLNDTCIFTGRLSKDLADEYIGKADLLLSPRIEGSNTPLKVYQQLASGIPLVATRIWSHTQVLTDDICFLADPEGLAVGQAMTEALTNPAEAEKRARAAMDVYNQKYARNQYEEKISKLLSALRQD